MLFFLQNLSNKGKAKQWKREKKQRNEQPWTLVYILVLQTMSFPLSTNWFSLQNDTM
jgi:hypothetical protein